MSSPAHIQRERARFWSRLGVSQDSLLQPEHRKMDIAPSGELTASMKVMGLLHAAHIGRDLVSWFAMRANAGQSRRFLSFWRFRVPDVRNLLLKQCYRCRNLRVRASA